MNIKANSQRTTLGFWKRLVLAVAAAGESYEERLEKRVSALEVAVARLTQSTKTRERDATSLP